jgi:hypothetical protein
MNGRIYDPTLGRFLQADPHIQAPKNSQNYNRYSYVLNNPMSYTDPSGYFFNKLFKAVNKALGDFAPILGIALLAIPGLREWSLASGWNAALFGFATGGDATGSLKGALVGAFSGATFHQIGGAFTEGAGGFLEAGGLGHIGTHAVTGGVISVLSGGKFGHGFLSAGLTKAINVNRMIGTAAKDAGLRIVSAATIGGTISKITGGTFANGATTAAFAQALNGESAASAEEKRKDLAAAALAMQGDESYRQDVKSRRFAAGTYKCNQFVADMLDKAGIPAVMLSAGSAEYMYANGWANENHHINGWEIVDQPMSGDVAAFARSTGSGHVGIYVEDKGLFNSNVMAANTNSVDWSKTHYRNDYSNTLAGAKADTVYRRYVGND